MSDIQKEYIKELIDSDNKSQVLNKYINKLVGTDNKFINIPEPVDLTISNIYIEANIKQLLNYNRLVGEEEEIIKCYTYIIIYHPKFYEVIMHNKTVQEYNETKNKMKEALEKIYENKNKDSKYEETAKILNIEIKEDNKEVNALEYCFYLSWANFNGETVDVDKKYFMDNNINDILTINISYGLQYPESLIRYIKTEDTNAPVLTEELIKNTTRYQETKIINKASEPVSKYDKNFNKIDKFKTNEVTVLIDYGTGYYTQCYLNNLPININFANDIYNRVIKANMDKRLLFDIINKDLYKYLPLECYHEKLDKELLFKTLDIVKNIVINSFSPDKPEQTVQNILHHQLLDKILDKNEKEIFKLYISYIPKLDVYNVHEIETYCCNYFYEDLLNDDNMLVSG